MMHCIRPENYHHSIWYALLQRYHSAFSAKRIYYDTAGGKNGRNDQLEGRNNHDRPAAKKTKTKLGKELNVFLAQARDESRVAPAVGDMGGDGKAYSRLVAKANLEDRKSRWPGRRNNGSKALAAGGGDRGTFGDPFGRSMTTSQRRRVAALEIAEDGGDDVVHLKASAAIVGDRSIGDVVRFDGSAYC